MQGLQFSVSVAGHMFEASDFFLKHQRSLGKIGWRLARMQGLFAVPVSAQRH